MANEHRTGRVNSGDVSIFYRAFGQKGRTPILIMHGAAYFDSYDWIGVASALSNDREVVAFDRRGWGESTWSPSKDYSLSAHVGDAMAVVAHTGWDKVIFMGHSASGRPAIALAANFPDKTAGMLVLDSPLGPDGPPGGGGGAARPTTGNPPTMYPSIDAAMAAFANNQSPPRFGVDRERTIQGLIKLENGYMLKRDPDSGNQRPIGEGAQLPRLPNREVWEELAALKSPGLYVRALKSDRMTDPKMIQRVSTEFPKLKMVTIDCRHDMAFELPDALLAHVRSFTATV
jgi:pimeloyl-ACP methyl ester carboxylesterase